MVIRLRNFSTNLATKVIVFILVVISITQVILQLQYLVYQKINPECLLVSEYKDSDTFMNEYVYNALNSPSLVIVGGSEMPKHTDYLYYFTYDNKTYTNTQNTDKKFFEHYDNAFYAFEKGVWSVGKNTNPKAVLKNYWNIWNIDSEKDKLTAYFAFTNEFLSKKQLEWKGNREKAAPIVINMISSAVLVFLLMIFLICVAGRKPQDKKLYLSKLDKIYSDILFASFLLLAMLWASFFASNINNSYEFMPGKLDIHQIFSMIAVGIVTTAILTLNISIIFSFVRKIKAGKLLKHSLIYTVCHKVYDFFKGLFDGRMFSKYPLTKSLFYRQLAFIVISTVLMFFTLVFIMAAPLFLLPLVLEIAIIYWYIKGNNKTFEDINKGFNESLEDQMRAERMKIALVTNVSHDLKTPLTSIISYVDLLSKEENLTDTASDYVKILAEKSNRLKNIVADLFDLAKSTSGNITLNLETLDVKKLIEQTLADMSDEIEKSGLQIKTKLPDNPVNIKSDGKKLYRVFQNVIDNTLKYSLSGTRVFIELEEIKGKAVTTIKNTSGYEIDFTPDEILQRFNRGDKSRTTEGSGLGLSIAESFTNACGGSFKLDIDGDLFKVTISL